MTVLRRMLQLVTCGVLAALICAPLAAGPAEADTGGTLIVRTVPATPGARFAIDGATGFADSHGVGRLPVRTFRGAGQRLKVPPTQVTGRYRVRVDRVVRTRGAGLPPSIVVGLRTERLVRWHFVDPAGRAVPAGEVSLLEMKSTIGQTVRLKGSAIARGEWLSAGRIQQTAGGLVYKPMRWRITRAVVHGAEVVNRGQQVFLPDHRGSWKIRLLFYDVTVTAQDLIFGSMTGDGVEIVRPDGSVARFPFDSAGTARLDHLARGGYDLTVYGGGLSLVRPMSVSRDEVVAIEVITWVDITLVVSGVALVAGSLVLIGRRQRFSRLWARLSARRGRLVVAVFVVLVMVPALVLGPVGGSPAHGAPLPVGAAPSPTKPPAFAYYYIWYQPTSWQRAKEDYPLLGRYSSDDPVIMRRHIAMAKAAGLTGFLVSWKDSGQLGKRLATLVEVARRADFKLGIVYQGLDFHRHPLPVQKVAADLQTFASTYASNPVFDTFGKPFVIITGSEQYSVAQLSAATKAVRGRLQILASAKSAEDYRRTAGVMDGDAYYWSSADSRESWYRPRLNSIAAEVRADHGLWVAPAAAGFDARQIGGSKVVERRNGETLKVALAAARASRPDAVGVISWNEFSENSHIEPSMRYGDQELTALAQALGGEVRLPPAMQSQRRTVPAGLNARQATLTLLALLAGAVLVGVVAVRRPKRLARRTPARGAPRSFITKGLRDDG